MAKRNKKEPELKPISREVQERTAAIIVPVQLIGGTIRLEPKHRETIKSMALSLSGSDLRNESYYEGYRTREPVVIKKAEITFEGDSLFINGFDMDCSLTDPAFTGMRVNLYGGGSFSLLFDFYIEGYGFSRKCVILNFAGAPLWQVEEAKIELPAKTGVLDTEKTPTAKTSSKQKPLDRQAVQNPLVPAEPAPVEKSQLLLF